MARTMATLPLKKPPINYCRDGACPVLGSRNTPVSHPINRFLLGRGFKPCPSQSQAFTSFPAANRTGQRPVTTRAVFPRAVAPRWMSGPGWKTRHTLSPPTSRKNRALKSLARFSRVYSVGLWELKRQFWLLATAPD
jgi:hypothetical protein